MAQVVLPNSINYDEQLPSLMPGVNNYTQVVQPINGSVFLENSTIYLDIPSRGFIDPKSIYIRYTLNVTQGAAQNYIIGCPAVSPFARLDTYFNSQLVDTQTDWNLIANDWITLNLGINEKYGNQFNFGYISSAADQTGATMAQLDSFNLGNAALAGQPYSFSTPLVCCMLSGCEKFIPAFATGGIRLALTVDLGTNYFTLNNATATISNFELVYDMIDFGPQIEQEVLSRPSIVIKSNSYNCASISVPNATNGSQTFVFNQRFASIRNCLIHPSGTAGANKKFDAIDITTGGTYQINVGGVSFPQGGRLSAGNTTGKAGILMELRKAVGSLYDWSKSFSINTQEFNITDATVGNTTAVQPGKFLVGVDLNKINSSTNMMLNGTSSQNSPINLLLTFGAATAAQRNLYMVLNYDAILTIDPRTKQLSVLQ